MNKELCRARVLESTRRVSLCSQVEDGRIIEMGPHAFPTPGQKFIPDRDTAYVEFHHSHAFPVTTIGAPDGSGGGTALHPQVVANSYESLFGKVFNFNHMMRSYDPDQYPRDSVLGTIMSVEFPPTPKGGWKVQASRAAAPGIRGVAAIHKAAENVPDILLNWLSGGRNPWSDTWTVSRELNYNKEESGFLLRGLGFRNARLSGDTAAYEAWQQNTPEDLAALGYVYVPALQAPLELIQCFNDTTCDVTASYRGLETLFLLSGLTGTVRYYGTGLTPLGKEPEAQVSRMLASGMSWCDPEGIVKRPPPVLQPLRAALAMKVTVGKS